ncbi:MAG: hypothetical protein ACRDP3_10700 [Streptomyces sp.]|uniref:hypothetical protein n=1 Tax=Streptomyces sp. TaxID=1931 RepID=UPI003D6BAE8C
MPGRVFRVIRSSVRRVTRCSICPGLFGLVRKVSFAVLDLFEEGLRGLASGHASRQVGGGGVPVSRRVITSPIAL